MGPQRYLTRRFWPMLGERLGDAVVLMVARSAMANPSPAR